MNILPIMQSKNSQDKASFRGVFQVLVPLNAYSLVKMNDFEKGLQRFTATAQKRVMDGHGRTGIIMSYTREDDIGVVNAIRTVIAEIRQKYGEIKVYRSNSIHGASHDEIKDMRIGDKNNEIFPV